MSRPPISGSLARRIQHLNSEIKALDGMLTELVIDTAPSLVDLYGVGTDTAATLLVAAGDNPGRLHSERSWAHLCGVCPIPAGSGKTDGRHRLNRGGDRQANAALYRIVLTRMSGDPTTKTYVASYVHGRGVWGSRSEGASHWVITASASQVRVKRP